jgi:hypothetical protein
MTQTIPASAIKAAGGLQKWTARQARTRKPKNTLLGFDAERMNKLEAQYAEHLETLRREGKILKWRFEEMKFRLADRTWYTPDFYVQMPDGAVEIHEAKGFWQDDARVKIKAVAEHFPEFVFVAVQRKNHMWMQEKFGVVK